MDERPSVFVSAAIRRGRMNQYNNMRSGRGSNPQVRNPQAAAYSPGSPRPARMPQPA